MSGSTRAARRAGSQQAPSATRPRAAATADALFGGVALREAGPGRANAGPPPGPAVDRVRANA